MNDAMVSGAVDLALTDQLFLDPNQVLIDKLTSGELAVAVSKRAKGLLDGIDDAIIKIMMENPKYTDLLEEEYTNNLDVKFYLTPSEQEVVEKYKKLTLAIDNNGVYQIYNSSKGTVQGINIKIFDRISEITGIEFEYMDVNSNNLLDLTKSHADLLGMVEKKEKSTREFGYITTTPYLVMPLVALYRVDDVVEEDETVGAFYKTSILFKDVKKYENLNDMFSALMTKEIGQAIVSSLNADYFIRKNGLNGIGRVPISDVSFRSCMAVRRDLPIELVNVLNRAILSLDQNEIRDMVANDEIFDERSLDSILKENPILIVLMSAFIFGPFSAFFFITMLRERKHKRQLFLLAKQDPMTKLWNKIAMEEKIETALENKGDYNRYALAILDIDFFKSVNDTYGHAAGDATLIHFSNLLKQYFSHDGAVGRYGGDEFVIFIKVTDEDMMRNRFEEFLNTGNFHLNYNGVPIKISTSIGIAVTTQNGEGRETLYKMADQALYEVKKAGRANYKIAGKENIYR